MKNIKNKAKIIAIFFASFIVFAVTFFAVAENGSSGNLFLDSDQDRLTDQEEKMLGTDPFKADTDGDGYSDGKEVESGYDPLKAAPGDKITATDMTEDDAISSNSSGDTDSNSNSPEETALGSVSDDPNDPNLTEEMIGQLLELTKEKAASSESFTNDPAYTSDDLALITKNALQASNITKDLPNIQDSDLNILPPIDDKNLSEEEIKSRQKTEIEKYLAQAAFILASNSPFPVENTSSLESNLNAESTNFFSALAAGDSDKIDAYAEKAQTGIDQMKKMEVPFVLKEIQKSMLQLAIYTLELKNDISLNTTDPVKSLAAASSLQSVAQSATKIQEELTQILSDYGIEAISFP